MSVVPVTGAQGLTLRTRDGVLLAADLYRPEGTPRGGVVVVHGFAGSRRLTDVVTQAEALVRRGFLVLTYDSRGHGDSTGSCTLGCDEAQDVEAAVDHLHREVTSVVTVGASMGARAVLQQATHPDGLAGVVVVSTATSWRSVLTPRILLATVMTRTRLGRALTRRRLGVRVAVERPAADWPCTRVARVHVPLAVVHGRDDRMVRPTAAAELYAAANEPRRLELVEGMGHSYGVACLPAVVRSVEWAFEQGRVRTSPRR